MSENACDGYYNSGVFSPIEMPGSPASVSSDSSCSTYTTEYVSQPSSPNCEDTTAMLDKPLKSSLRRAGQPSTRPRRTVTWDPNTVFETRPWLGKRRRSQVDEEDDDSCGALQTSFDADGHLPAPTPTKKAKFAEFDGASSASSVHQTSLHSSGVLPIFPEASRIVIPMFDFSSVLPLETGSPNSTTSQTSVLHTPSPSLSERPSVAPFTLTPKRKPFVVRSNLIAASAVGKY